MRTGRDTPDSALRSYRVGWLYAGLAIVIAILVGAFLLDGANSEDLTVDELAAELALGIGSSNSGKKSPWLDGGLKSTISGGLWASADAKGYPDITLRLEPGNDPDEDEWHFLVRSTDVYCVPQVTETHWLFSRCSLDGSLRDFSARVSRQPDYPVEVTFQDASEVRRLRMRKISDNFWH